MKPRRFFILYAGKHPDPAKQRLKHIVMLHWKRKCWRVAHFETFGVNFESRTQKKSPQFVVTGKASRIEIDEATMTAKIYA